MRPAGTCKMCGLRCAFITEFSMFFIAIIMNNAAALASTSTRTCGQRISRKKGKCAASFLLLTCSCSLLFTSMLFSLRSMRKRTRPSRINCNLQRTLPTRCLIHCLFITRHEENTLSFTPYSSDYGEPYL